MKRILMIMLMFPLINRAQTVLTGTWRLKESKVLNGPDYINALPLIITIRQEPNVIVFESTVNNGEIDSFVKEAIAYSSNGGSESNIQNGRRKTVSFGRGEDNNSWVKQTKINANDDSFRLLSENKETFRIWPDGIRLTILKEYNALNEVEDNQDFIIDGTYERITTEQARKNEVGEKGVLFLNGFSWKQILTKARKENKIVFVDCYATWCRPCKMMDKFVYPLSSVGDVMKAQYIAVKVQMDTAKNDPEYIRKFYSLARKLEVDYNISSLPTYLFFGPDGRILHKATGQQDEKKFIELLTEVRRPENQLFTVSKKAKKKELPWGEYPSLVKRLNDELGEKKIANEIASFYIKEYLNKLNENTLLRKEHLDFIDQNISVVRSSDKILKLCLKMPHFVDSIKGYGGDGWAEDIVHRTINREEIEPQIQRADKAGKEPNWLKLEQMLATKYNNQLLTTYVLDARVSWYRKKEKWSSFLQFLKPHLSTHDLNEISGIYLNSCVWKVFKYSNDSALMKDALGWIDVAISTTPKLYLWMVMDTKACLLFKMGRKDQAIEMIQQIIRNFPEVKEAMQPRLEQMTKGGDIWQVLN